MLSLAHFAVLRNPGLARHPLTDRVLILPHTEALHVRAQVPKEPGQAAGEQKGPSHSSPGAAA